MTEDSSTTSLRREAIQDLLGENERLTVEVERLRGLILRAYVAGAVWAVKGLPLTGVEEAAQSAGTRWLKEQS